MGRGRSGKQPGKGKQPKQEPTKAVQVENMNEAQIDLETRKAQRALSRVEAQIDKLRGGSQEERDMRDAFPLGTGGLNRAAAQKKAGQFAERARINAGKLSDALDKRDSLQRQLDRLEKAKQEVAGTGKTQKQVRDEKKAAEVKNTAQTMKWKTTSKGGWVTDSNGTRGYAPKVIQAGSYEIHGSSGFYRVYVGHGQDAKQIWTASKLSEAKAYAEKHKKRQGG